MGFAATVLRYFSLSLRDSKLIPIFTGQVLNWHFVHWFFESMKSRFRDLVTGAFWILFRGWRKIVVSWSKSSPDAAGFILADLKLEFGLLDGEIVLGDSIGPDEYRLWPKETYEIGKIQESYDKQILRDWLTANGYQKQFEDDRNSGKEPIAPEIPSEIIQTITQRYVIAYEKLTRLSL